MLSTKLNCQFVFIFLNLLLTLQEPKLITCMQRQRKPDYCMFSQKKRKKVGKNRGKQSIASHNLLMRSNNSSMNGITSTLFSRNHKTPFEKRKKSKIWKRKKRKAKRIVIIERWEVLTWWWKAQGEGFLEKVGKRTSSNNDREYIGPLRWLKDNC